MAPRCWAGWVREVEEILDGLRHVGRGLYPPLLGEHGLAAALRAELRDHDGTELLIGGRRPQPVRARDGRLPELSRGARLPRRGGRRHGDADRPARGARADWLRVNLAGPADGAPDGLAERVAGHMRDAVSALGGRADATGAASGRWSVTAYVPWPRTGDGAS